MIAYISLGSNIGDRARMLKEAISQLHLLPGIQVTGCSHMYETEPVGFLEQPPFINMVISVKSTRSPLDLLQALLEVEQRLGRVRHFVNGPRTIDLDLLLYGHVEVNTAQLTLPHPRMFERSFVLVPLVELMGKQQSDEREAMINYLQKCEGREGVVLWKKVDWQEESGLLES